MTFRCCASILLLASAVRSDSADARTLGLVLDNSLGTATRSVVAFDADADSVIGSLQLPRNIGALDCSISQRQRLGLVTSLTHEVHVIDLTGPPVMANGTNPIAISNFGLDTSLTPDGACLIVCGGALPAPISSIDIVNREEVDTLSLEFFQDCASVDACTDGTVLVSSSNSGFVHRLAIDGSCMLADTEDSIFTGGSGALVGPKNLTCAPDAASLATLRRSPFELRTFSTSPLQGPLSVVRPGGPLSMGVTAVFSPMGEVLYTLSQTAVDAFDYEAGRVGALRPGFPFPARDRAPLPGVDQLAVHPDGSKLYVPNPGRLDVLDAHTGALLTSIVDPAISRPLGVCLGSIRQVEISIGSVGDPRAFPLRSRGVVPVAILGSETFEVTEIDEETLHFELAMPFHKVLGHLEDVNEDDFLDLLSHYAVADTGIASGQTEACVEGALLDGTPFAGCDAIRAVPASR